MTGTELFSGLRIELRMAMIAGQAYFSAANTAKLGRFRDQFEKHGQKAPVMARIALLLEKIGNDVQHRAAALMEAAAFIAAVDITQASAQIEGEMTVPEKAWHWKTDSITHSDALKLHHALTGTGNHKFDTVHAAMQNGTAYDIRFAGLMADSLGHSVFGSVVTGKLPFKTYKKMRALEYEGVSAFGEAVLPLVTKAFNPKSTTMGNVNRFATIVKIRGTKDSAFYRDLYRKAGRHLRPYVYNILAQSDKEALPDLYREALADPKLFYEMKYELYHTFRQIKRHKEIKTALLNAVKEDEEFKKIHRNSSMPLSVLSSVGAALFMIPVLLIMIITSPFHILKGLFKKK